jgi:hypothetical protein
MDFYASNNAAEIDKPLGAEKPSTHISIDEIYGKLARDAYYKIIAEAEIADIRLREEYHRLLSKKQDTGTKKDKEFKSSITVAFRKYRAHKEMLEGLKSWNIMSVYGTDDLDFFKAENKGKVAEMIAAGRSQDFILNYLIYKLADLYHFENR